jgi:2-polyprenyl-3-methyl-5-hydroxy-6-metoxy-1,4-benzoquinol methylase
MSIEEFYKRLGTWRFRLNRVKQFLKRKNSPAENIGKFLKDFAVAKDDAQEFLGIDEKEFWRLVEIWPVLEEKLFHNRQDLEEFYRSWSGDFARANICANLFNQFLSADVYHAVGPHIARAQRVLDYGCGTASVTLAHALRSPTSTEFMLIELQEEIREFIGHRVAKHSPLQVQARDIHQIKDEQPFDLVMCIDVLEHLEKPSEVFINSLLPKVMVGGHLILRAPWRGQLTHIDAAPEDFYSHGGRKALSKYFIEIQRIGVNDVDAVYKRIR